MAFVLITGASRGIGRAIAETFAQRGKDLLLVARSAEQLQETAQDIQSRHKVQVHVLSADLSAPEGAQQVFDWCIKQQYAVDTLVNNAGYGLSGPFEQYPLRDHLNMMQVNMNAVVELTYLFLPLLRRQPQGYILNIASSAGFQATPFLSVYAATKSFVRLFSRGLHRELRGTNVSVTCVNPGATDTAFNDRAQVGKKARDLARKVQMTPEAVANTAVAALYARKTEVVTGLINKLGVFLVWLLPKKTIENSASKIYQ